MIYYGFIGTILYFLLVISYASTHIPFYNWVRAIGIYMPKVYTMFDRFSKALLALAYMNGYLAKVYIYLRIFINN